MLALSNPAAVFLRHHVHCSFSSDNGQVFEKIGTAADHPELVAAAQNDDDDSSEWANKILGDLWDEFQGPRSEAVKMDPAEKMST